MEHVRAQKGEIDALGATSASDPSVTPELAGTVAVASVDIQVVAEMSELRPFGPFTRVERLTEQGAMGVVARGYNEAFDRWELLKFLRPDLSKEPEFVRQFFREGRALAKLSHPNVVQAFAIYALDGRPCLAMEFLEGVSLAAHVAHERAPIARWHELFLAAARGLAAAHDMGLLHRDIKPENLFVVHDRTGTPRDLKLIDFGLATADRSRHADPTHDPTLLAAVSGGTPLYMAPELWRGEEASPRTDLYALGQSFFFALTGRLPFVGETVGQVRTAVCSKDPFPDPRDLRPDLPAPLALVLRRSIAKPKEERFATVDELIAALVAAASAARPRRVPGSGPYRGLGAYSAAERDVFFGRDTEVAEVLEHLRDQSGVVLVGPSGSGKSSLAHAGIVPAIAEGALGGGIAYSAVQIEPRARPIHSLAVALARELRSAEAEVETFLRATPARLGAALRAALPQQAGMIVVIDQLEELATVAEDPGEALCFAAAIASLIEVSSSPVRVIATLRADLMERLFTLEPLRPLLTRGFYPVRPMGSEALRQAMIGPALAADYRLEDPGIVDGVIADVARTPGGLPLLSFAMAAWWEARDEANRTLPTAAWVSLGGLTGALTRHGDRVLDAMSDDARRLAEQILVRLVSADRTRTRISRASLLDPAAWGPGASHVLERLLTAKLVHESAGELELVHEALITQWPRLRDLLASSGEDRAFRERVSAAARQWDAQGHPDGALWTGDQATRLARWFAHTNASLDQLELAFVEAVRRRARRSRVVLRSVGIAAALVVLSYGVLAGSNAREMGRRLDAANLALGKAKKAYVQAETGRLNDLATFEAQHDPGASLRHAAASYELEHDPTLDVMAWNARALGLAIVLPSPGGPISAVRVSPSNWIAALGAGSVQLLATASPEHVTLPADAGGTPTAIAFSADGRTLAVGTSSGRISFGRAPSFALHEVGHCDGAIRQIVWSNGLALFPTYRTASGALRVLWVEAATGASHAVFEGALAGTAFASEANVLVLASADGRVTKVDAATGEVTPGPVFPLGDVTAIDVSPKGDVAILGEASGDVVEVSIASPAKPSQGAGLPESRATPAPSVLEHRPGPVLRVARAPSGASLAIDGSRSVEIRADGAIPPFQTELGARAFAWIPRRNAVAVVGRGGEVLVVSLASLEVIGKIPNPGHEITSLDADATGEWLVAGASDGALEAFNLEQGAQAVTQGSVRPAPSACALSPDGAAVACASAGSVVVRTVERSRGVPRAATSFTLAGAPDFLALGPRGAPLFAGLGGGLLRDGLAARLPLATTSLVEATDDRVALAGKGADDRPALVVASLDLAHPLAPSTLPSPVTALAWTADGARVLVATADRTVRALEPSTNGVREVSSFAVPTADEISALDASDDGARIAIGTVTGDMFLNAANGAHKLAALHDRVGCLRFARAGRAIVAAADRRVSVVDGDSGLSFALWTSSTPVAHCARSPGEDRFSFVDDDGATWLKAVDLEGVAESYVPGDPALGAPTIEGWKGLPVGLVR